MLLGVLLVGLIGISFWWRNGLKPVNPSNRTEKIFVIRRGENARQIAASLAKAGLVRDPVAFFLYVKKEGKEKDIQAGDYRISSSMDLPTVVHTLLHGTLDEWVTIPEGLRAEEVSDILKRSFTTHTDLWTQALKREEGYLFPDTYLIPRDADIDLIIATMKDNFFKRIKEINLSRNRDTLGEIVIIASLIEREVKYDEEKPLASSVMYNRLKENWHLEIDATVQYALSYQEEDKSWWKKRLALSDLKVDSPYNTYKITGPPPSPISSPGLLSLKAAAFPSTTDYYFYVSDRDGHLHFAKTLFDHHENIKKYIKN